VTPHASLPRPWSEPMATNRAAAAQAGIGFGTALAITISWSLHHSVVWAVIHGVLSWLYVVYYVVTR